MVDEQIRQRIKYLVEHGELMPQEPPASRKWLLGVAVVIAALQIIEIGLHLFGVDAG